jgi:hypothetical protein
MAARQVQAGQVDGVFDPDKYLCGLVHAFTTFLPCIALIQAVALSLRIRNARSAE